MPHSPRLSRLTRAVSTLEQTSENQLLELRGTSQRADGPGPSKWTRHQGREGPIRKFDAVLCWRPARSEPPPPRARPRRVAGARRCVDRFPRNGRSHFSGLTPPGLATPELRCARVRLRNAGRSSNRNSSDALDDPRLLAVGAFGANPSPASIPRRLHKDIRPLAVLRKPISFDAIATAVEQ